MDDYWKISKGFKDYDNWRYLKYVKPLYMNISVDEQVNHQIIDKYLMVLLGNYYLIKFPTMSIIEYLNVDFPRGVGLIDNRNIPPTYCQKCCGAGKFDWVSDITGPCHIYSKYEFVKDKHVVLLYRKSNGEFSKSNIWAPTEVDIGERICDDCLGTGIDLINTNPYFHEQPLKDLRSRLVLCDIRHFI